MRHTQVSVHTRSGVPSFLPQLSPIAQVLACQTRHAFCCVRGELGRNGIAASAVALGTLLEMVEEGAQRSFTLNRYRKSCAAAERLPCIPHCSRCVRQNLNRPSVMRQVRLAHSRYRSSTEKRFVHSVSECLRCADFLTD